MLARLRKAVEENEEGFTLIELLVVMIIIGILAAIAIPVFLNQRKKAVDSSMKSDLRTVATSMETTFTDKQSYKTWDGKANALNSSLKSGGSPAEEVSISNGNMLSVTAAVDSFCIVAKRDSSVGQGSQDGWVWDSQKGGLQASGVTTCSSPTSSTTTP